MDLFLKKAEKIWAKDQFDYSKVDYQGSRKKITIICKIHDLEFEQTPDHHLQNYNGCKSCVKETAKKGKKGTIKKTNEEFINDAISIHGCSYDYSLVEYNGNLDKVKIICREHGEFEQKPSHHLLGSGCKKCSSENVAFKKRKTVEQFIEEANEIHSNKYIYDEVSFKNNKSNIKIKCKEHNTEFEQQVNSHLRGYTGCISCNNYISENCARHIFENYTGKKFVKCKHDWLINTKTNCKMELDGYNKELSIAFEYQGEQHYKFVKFFHKTEENYNKMLERDLLKKKLCQDNEIKLIIIPFHFNSNDKPAMEEYIISQLKEINIVKKVKILFIGDQHFKVNNIPQVNVFLSKLKNWLENNKDLDFIVSGGDLLDTHERLHTEPLNKAVEYIKLLSSYSRTFILVGNHDKINNSQHLTDNHWLNFFKKFKNVTVVDRVINHEIFSKKFTLCPYVPDGRFIEALKSIEDEWIDSECVFAHQLFDGVKMGSIIASGVEKWPITFPQIISGHIHDRQWVQNNLYYVGSSMQHAFSEGFDKTLLLLEINESLTKESFIEIDLDLPKKKTIYLDAEELDEFDLEKIEKGTDYKVTVHGNQEEFDSFKKTAKYKQLSKLCKVNFKHKKTFVVQQKEFIENTMKKPNELKNFNMILEELIKKENDQHLEVLFHNIIYGQQKEVPSDLELSDDDLIIAEDDKEEDSN